MPRSNGNQTMKFGPLIEYYVANIFLQNHAENEAGILKNASYNVKKQVTNTFVLIYFGRPQLGHTMTTNLKTIQTVHPEVCSILIFHKRIWD